MIAIEHSPSLEAWLEARLADVPPALADAVRSRARGSLPEGAEGLVSAALAGFDVVAGAPDARVGALELLAADALLTYAFEAAADPGLGGDAGRALRLADRVGPGGLIGAAIGGRMDADPGGPEGSG